MNLESMASKPYASGGSKDCAAWKVEKAVHYFVNSDKGATDSSTRPLKGCLTWDVAQPLYNLQRKFLNTF